MSDVVKVAGQSIRSYGFAVMRDVVDPALAQDVLAAVTALEADGVERWWSDFELGQPRLYNLLAKGDVFAALVDLDVINELVDDILGPGALVSSVVSLPVESGAPRQPLHSDDQGLGLPRVSGWAYYLTFIVPLSGMGEENGGTRLIPGTHLAEEPLWWNETERAAVAEADCVQPQLATGDVLVYDSGVFHGAGSNGSPNRRDAIGIAFCRGGLRPIENQMLGIPRSTVQAFTPRLIQRCGYSIFNNMIGHVDRRDPAEFLRREGDTESRRG